MQKDLIERLGGKCQVCSSTKMLQVNHRWYVSEDQGTGGKWKRILELYEKEPDRFSCLCSRCNRLSGQIIRVKNEPAGIYNRLMNEVSKMAEGRQHSPLSYQILSKRRYKDCFICGRQIEGKGKTCSEECRENLDISRRRKYVPDPRTKECAACGKAFRQRSNSKTCSKECSKKYRYNRHLFANRKYQECVICGEPLTGKGKTCGSECSTKLQMYTSRKKERRRYQHITLECRTCGKAFQRKYPRQLTCSNECRLEWRSRAKIDNCVVCGNRFEKRTGNQITCSKDCMAKRLYQAQILSCTICDKTFRRKGNSKTCSNECSERLRTLRRHETQHKNWHLVTLKCVVCGSEFPRRYGVQKTCSEKCRQQYKKERRDTVSKEIREKRLMRLHDVDKSKN